MSKNIVLLTIDCLRPDHLGCYGYSKNTSPHIDNLAQQGSLFTNCFSTATFTPASFVSLFGSSYPQDYSHYLPFPERAVPFYKILNENGYTTIGLNSNVWITKRFNYGPGFDVFKLLGTKRKNVLYALRDFIFKISAKIFGDAELFKLLRKAEDRIKNIVSSQKKTPYLIASKLTDEILKELDICKDKNFFLWAHYMDLHYPRFTGHIKNKRFVSLNKKKENRLNSIVGSNQNNLSEEDFDNILKIYDENIHYVDSHIGRINKKLKELKIYDNTLIIITADHGEEFKEHGKFKHDNAPYDELLKVPLIIKDGKKSIQENLVSILDIPYTLLDINLFQIPSNYKGRNLYTSKRNEIFSEYYCTRKYFPAVDNRLASYNIKCVRDTDYKFIINKNTNKKELYNIREDKKEKYNLSSSRKDLVNHYLNRIEKHFKNREKVSKTTKTNKDSNEDIKEKLKSLGYLD